MNKKDEINSFLTERKKWKHFFEILSRRYIYIPLIIVFFYLIDDPNINILKFLKRLAGLH